MATVKDITETQAKERIGTWLQKLGCQVFDEKNSKIGSKYGWAKFDIQGVYIGRSPDLLVFGDLYSGTTPKGRGYVAVEVKSGWGHKQIVQGFEQVLGYFMDYCWGAKYLVEGKPVELTAIVLATYYSQDGYIYRFEKDLLEKDPQIAYKFMPGWPASPLVASLSRVMWAMRDRIEETFKGITMLPNGDRALAQTAKGEKMPLRNRPLVGILAKKLRKSGKLPYEVEMHLSEAKPYYSWGIVGLRP